MAAEHEAERQPSMVGLVESGEGVLPVEGARLLVAGVRILRSIARDFPFPRMSVDFRSNAA